MNIFKKKQLEPETVKCENCRHLVEKRDCRKVLLESRYFFGSQFMPGGIYRTAEGFEARIVFYCKLCDPKCDKIDVDGKKYIKVPEHYERIKETKKKS